MKPRLVRSEPLKGRLWTAQWKRTAENAPYGAHYELFPKGRQGDTNQLKALYCERSEAISDRGVREIASLRAHAGWSLKLHDP
jgi:hypothetical protein